MSDARNKARIESTALQICKIGDSLGVILPQELVTRLNLKEGDHLYPVQQPDGSLRLVPYDPKHARAMEIGRKMMDEYRDTFIALAK
jgi:putative addiction module antidote